MSIMVFITLTDSFSLFYTHVLLQDDLAELIYLDEFVDPTLMDEIQYHDTSSIFWLCFKHREEDMHHGHDFYHEEGMYMFIFTYTCIHACIQTYICTFGHIQFCTYIHTYT
jgi:hypothetical protein